MADISTLTDDDVARALGRRDLVILALEKQLAELTPPPAPPPEPEDDT